MNTQAFNQIVLLLNHVNRDPVHMSRKRLSTAMANAIHLLDLSPTENEGMVQCALNLRKAYVRTAQQALPLLH